jgi:excisionase family DNA binding protein
VPTVLEAASIALCTPGTVRRWIRAGKLRACKVSGRYVVDDQDLDRLVGEDLLPLPPELRETITGEPMPNIVAILRRQRASH